MHDCRDADGRAQEGSILEHPSGKSTVNADISQSPVRDGKVPTAHDRTWGRREVGEKRRRWNPLFTVMEMRAQHSHQADRLGQVLGRSQVSGAVEPRAGKDDITN